MKYSEAKQGRIFIIRLEDGDIIHEEIGKFSKKKSIKAAFLIIVGGVDKNSKLVVGPEHGRVKPLVPMEYILDNVHEAVGTGTIFSNKKGDPILHMHIACGREGSTTTGCIREGVITWNVMEIILIELIETQAIRAFDPNTGFELLTP
ncbi:MAG TPA: PPC domain-containing DNA-binding protein [Victivallales bacterium]|nr:PPC domain-containing DNA-binding protein [Victivallales bacterium]